MRLERARLPAALRRAIWVGCLVVGMSRAEVARGADAFGSYEIGQIAPMDLVAPMDLEVVDAAGTEQIRREAASEVSWIYRFEDEVERTSEKRLREAFQSTREEFLGAMRQAARREALDQQTVQNATFTRFTDWFQRQHPSFPLSTNLARVWAMHQSDHAILEDWLGKLRQWMSRPVISVSDKLPPPEEGGTLRIVSARRGSETLDASRVEREGVSLPYRECLTLAQARASLQRSLYRDDPALGVYLSGFLRENCFPEEELILKLRQTKLSGLVATDRYQAGDIIVRRGQVIDHKAKAALDLIPPIGNRSEAEATEATEGVEVGIWDLGLEVWNQVCRNIANPTRLESAAVLGLCLTAVISVLGAVFLAWMIRRKRSRRQRDTLTAAQEISYTVVMNPQKNETVFLPSPIASGSNEPGASSVAAPGDSDPIWQHRAMEAERRAEEILTLVRAGLAPQLARQMMHHLVRELVTQRAQWMDAQRVAEHDLAEIERRFVASHAQLQDQLRSFEKRAVELERALMRKSEENSALLKAQIAITQQQKDAQQLSHELTWN